MNKVLALLLISSLFLFGCVGYGSQPAPGAGPAPVENGGMMTVQEFSLTARQWEFQPSTITVKKDIPVKLTITSTDVAHGFALTDFNVNSRLEPGQATVVQFTPDRAGTFNFFCSVVCGSGHGGMRGTLVVTE